MKTLYFPKPTVFYDSDKLMAEFEAKDLMLQIDGSVKFSGKIELGLMVTFSGAKLMMEIRLVMGELTSVILGKKNNIRPYSLIQNA